MKVIVTTTALFISLCLASSFAAQEENTVLLYLFDKDTKDKAEDLSPEKHPGKIIDAKWRSDGKFGGGLEFNGKSSLIEVPHHASLQPGGDKLTVEAWFKPASFPGGHPPIARKGSVAESGWGFDTPGGKPRGFVYTAPGNAAVAQGASTMKLNAWNHLAMVYDGKEVRVYLDGQLDGSIARSGNINKNDASVWIGKKANENIWLDGILDELVILNVALSEKEIQENMKGISLAVAPSGKLATAWGAIKAIR
jgi:hypothetical protein